jgi:hypothetical protein
MKTGQEVEKGGEGNSRRRVVSTSKGSRKRVRKQVKNVVDV